MNDLLGFVKKARDFKNPLDSILGVDDEAPADAASDPEDDSSPPSSQGKENKGLFASYRSSKHGSTQKHKAKSSLFKKKYADSDKESNGHTDGAAEELSEQNSGSVWGRRKRSWRSKSLSLPEGEDGEQNGENDHLQAFFDEVAGIKGLLAEIAAKQRKIISDRDRCKTLTKVDAVRALRETIEEDVSNVVQTGYMIKSRLDHLDRLTEAAVGGGAVTDDDDEVPKAPAVVHAGDRMRLTVTCALRKKFKDQMGEFTDLRQAWAAEDRANVERQIYTVTGQRFDEQAIDELIETGGSDTIFQQAILGGNGHAVNTLVEIEKRHDQMRKLEASLAELHQIFCDMAVLVEAQGQQLDSIEAWVVKTRESVEVGLQQLRVAKNSRKKAQQKKAITFTTGAVVAAVGAGMTASGVAAPIGVPLAIAGGAIAASSAIF